MMVPLVPASYHVTARQRFQLVRSFDMRSIAARPLVALCAAVVSSPVAVPAQRTVSGAARDSATRTVVAPPSGAEPFAAADMRVFDGERLLPRATLPAAVVDGRGRTLLPGLIDAHVHS
jgi:hypothetical protein